MKKKILSVLLCSVAFIAAAASALSSQNARYDLDGDGQLTAGDASVIYAYILDTADEAVTLSLVDVNGDGTVNTLDVVAVYVAVKDFVAVAGITLDKASLSLVKGDTALLTATVSPDDASDKTVTWASDNTSVATVDADGKVIAIAPGTATITVTTTDGSFKATCIIEVKEPAQEGLSGYGDDTYNDFEFGEKF